MAQQPCSDVTLLLLDDETVFRESLAENLRMDGHTVHDFASPNEVPALQTLPRPAAVITDYEMPGANGLVFADTLASKYPDVPVILVTTHHTDAIQHGVEVRPSVQLLQKPVVYEDLHALIHRLAR